MLSHTKVRLGNRIEKEQDRSFGSPMTSVPEHESEDESREQKEEDEEEGVVDGNENEDGDRETQKEDGYENVEDKRWYGLEEGMVVSQNRV